MPVKGAGKVLGVLGIAVLALAGWLWTPDLDRAALEAKYAPWPSRFVAAAGLRIHVRESGPPDGAPVILLHGFGSSLHTWEAWADGLSDRRRVIRLDLPGSGLTGADPSDDYSDPRGVEVLAALMDTLGVARASLVGHSMGGRIAWRFAAAYPERVDRLVLVAPDGFASPEFAYGVRPEVPASARLMRFALPRALVRMSLAPAFADRSAIDDALVSRYYDLLRAPGVRPALIARLEQSTRTDPLPMLRRIETPTLLVWGDADAMIPVATADDFLRAMPHAELVRLSGVGHLPQEECPARVLPEIRAFLERRDE
jgi:pimeloyl-ACP methyl ester carboxylesterase